MTRPRFEVESSVKLFEVLSARATNGPAKRFKESRESRAPINTRVKETVKISTCSRHRARRKSAYSSTLAAFIPENELIANSYSFNLFNPDDCT